VLNIAYANGEGASWMSYCMVHYFVSIRLEVIYNAYFHTAIVIQRAVIKFWLRA